MAKLTLTQVASAYESIQAINANYTLIEAAIENTVSRDGTTPNSMAADLDMNGNNILNAGVLTYSDNRIISEQTAHYTTILADASKLIEMNSSSARNITIPPNSEVAHGVGTYIDIVQAGTGTVTIVAGSGVTINTRDTLVLNGQWAIATIYKRATDEWVLFGRLVV